MAYTPPKEGIQRAILLSISFKVGISVFWTFNSENVQLQM